VCVAARAAELKAQGNKTFAAGQYKFARSKYQKAIKLISHTFDFESEEQVCVIQGLAFEWVFRV
jgi:muramidase (phage lysozyme)